MSRSAAESVHSSTFVRRDVGSLYVRHVNQTLAIPVTRVANRLGMTPNGLTAVGVALWVAGCAVVLTFNSSLWGLALAGALWSISYVFDSADGQLARLQRSGSEFGGWLDHTIDAARSLSVSLSIAMVLVIREYGLLPLAFVFIGIIVTETAYFGLLNSPGTDLSQESANRMRGKKRLISEPIRLIAETGVSVWYVLALYSARASVIVFGLWALASAINSVYLLAREFRTLSAQTTRA